MYVYTGILTFEPCNEHRRDDPVEVDKHLWTRAEDSCQALGRRTTHLPADIIIITVLVILLSVEGQRSRISYKERCAIDVVEMRVSERERERGEGEGGGRGGEGGRERERES